MGPNSSLRERKIGIRLVWSVSKEVSFSTTWTRLCYSLEFYPSKLFCLHLNSLSLFPFPQKPKPPGFYNSLSLSNKNIINPLIRCHHHNQKQKDYISLSVRSKVKEGDQSMDSIPEMDSSNSENTSINTSSNSSAATSSSSASTTPSRYENQKRRDWNTFGQYLKNHRPPLSLSRCSGAHVLEFLRYLDQFGKTKPEANPFGARAVRLYLREVRDLQSKARGISYEKKKRKRLPQQMPPQLPPPGAS
ncbi:unnamed protein product, partial [Vitis vinifera]